MAKDKMSKILNAFQVCTDQMVTFTENLHKYVTVNMSIEVPRHYNIFINMYYLQHKESVKNCH